MTTRNIWILIGILAIIILGGWYLVTHPRTSPAPEPTTDMMPTENATQEQMPQTTAPTGSSTEQTTEIYKG
ncbi:MAG: hypothetical protein WAV21_00315 [Minisyncoccia bacterium]